MLSLRYEDLVDDPPRYLQQIMNLVGLEFEPEQLQFRRAEHHILSGNRMRWSKNQEIRKDLSYIENIPWYQWYGADLIAYRGLKKFDYSFFR